MWFQPSLREMIRWAKTAWIALVSFTIFYGLKGFLEIGLYYKYRDGHFEIYALQKAHSGCWYLVYSLVQIIHCYLLQRFMKYCSNAIISGDEADYTRAVIFLKKLFQYSFFLIITYFMYHLYFTSFEIRSILK